MHQQTNSILHDDIKACFHDIDQKIGELKLLVNLIENSPSEEVESRNNFEGYQLNWNWASKIIFIIRRVNRPLRVVEVLEYMLSIPDTTLNTKRNLPKSLAANFGGPFNSKRLNRYKIPGIKPYFYCLPEWMDENGQMKEKYMNKMQTEL